MLGVKMFFRKSDLVSDFITIRKYATECDGIVALYTHGNWFRIDLQRQMKCDVPTRIETLHPQHLQTREFRRQWGTNTGLQATPHIWQTCELQSVQLQNLPRSLSATSMKQHKWGPLVIASPAMYFPAAQGMSVAPSGRLPSVRRRPDGSFVLGTSALCYSSERQMMSFMAWWRIELPVERLKTSPQSPSELTASPFILFMSSNSNYEPNLHKHTKLYNAHRPYITKLQWFSTSSDVISILPQI